MPKNNAVTVVYTGDGKGKTSAGLGLMVRSLGAGNSVAFIQFIKHWHVSEHDAIESLQKIYGQKLSFYKGGKGFYNAGEMSAEGISQQQHKDAATETLRLTNNIVESGKVDLVICDEINNAVQDGLIQESALADLIKSAGKNDVSLCLTGRNFPRSLLDAADIVTEMKKLRHHYDEGILASKGIDY